jgi:hypothetical protein
MRDQSHLNLLGTIFERKLIALNPKEKSLKGEFMIWKTKMQTRVQGTVQLKDSIGFKLGPNWSLGIWTLDPI